MLVSLNRVGGIFVLFFSRRRELDRGCGRDLLCSDLQSSVERRDGAGLVTGRCHSCQWPIESV